ncbi:DMT family transporter [Hydrogenophilus thermoluteolus]|uniref:DMT family transporter n=1 Tax=Hydrogenophilus thermoluteolus TaxID=297 RepID=UPI003F678F01
MRLSHCAAALRHAHALLFYTVSFWSGNMVLARAFRDDLPPIQLAMARWVIAFFLCLPFALPLWRTHWPQIKTHWRLLTLLGVLGVGCYNTFAYMALQYTTAINATLLNTLIPIATMLLAAVLVHEPISGRKGMGIALALLGVATVITHGDWTLLAQLEFNRGDLWMLAAVFSWALYTVLLRRRPAGIDPLVQLLFYIAVGIVVLIPFTLWEHYGLGKVPTFSLTTLLVMAYTGLFPGFLGYIFYNAAVAVVGASTGSLFLYAMPVLAALLSILFLGESPQWYHAMGFVLVFAGILITLPRTSPSRIGHSR